jgi:hypothetical protein
MDLLTPTRPNYQGIGAPLRRVEDRRFLLGRSLSPSP